MHRTSLQLLHEYGQSPWLEALSPTLARNGELERLVRDHGIRGVSAGSRLSLSPSDVQRACDLLLPIWAETGGADGHVSLGPTTEGATRLGELVDRPNLVVQVPATAAGLAAIEHSIGAGVSVDATAIFSLSRYGEVVASYMRGIERLVAAGGDPASVTSVATVHVSPIDAEVDRRLAAIGDGALRLRGRLGIATAKLAYQHYKEAFGSRSWDLRAARGARRQRCRWASTSGEAVGYWDVVYVEELIGAETVTTLAPCTLHAFEDHGVVADNLERGIDDAREVFDEIRAAGVDLDDVWRTLEGGALPRP